MLLVRRPAASYPYFVVNAAGLEMPQDFPAVTLVRGQLVSVATARAVEIRDGCLQELLPKEQPAAPDPPPCYINAFMPNRFFPDPGHLVERRCGRRSARQSADPTAQRLEPQRQPAALERARYLSVLAASTRRDVHRGIKQYDCLR